MLMTKTLYVDDLAKALSVQSGKPATKYKRLIKNFEEILASELKAKDRVKLQNFGTFYLIHQDSRHIIQIRTKQRRILINTTIIKFRPSLKVKHKLHPAEEKTLKIAEPIKEVQKPIVISVEKEPETKPAPPEKKIVTLENKTEGPNCQIDVESKQKPVVKAEPPTPKPAPETEKFERVDREKIRAEIAKRLSNLEPIKKSSEKPLITHRFLDSTGEGRIFSLIFKRIKKLNSSTINFYLFDQNKTCQVFYGKPRSKLGIIPKQTAISFLRNHLEIDNFDLPQERFVKFYSSSKMDIGWIVFVHTLPLAEGSSVYVKLVKEI